MIRKLSVLSLLLFVLCNVHAVDLNISVDATQLPRKLVYTQIEIPVKSGKVGLFYPEWIPGIHGPRGPLENLAEVSVADAKGNPVGWERDPRYAFRFVVDVPRGVSRITVRTTYIASQPSVNSRGIDTYGTPLLGGINWNTLLLYPDDVEVNKITAHAKLTLPEGWGYGTSLDDAGREGNTVSFKPLTLEELIDSPVICGQHFRRFDITPDDVEPKHYLDLVANSAQELNVKDEIIVWLKKMSSEAKLMFGGFHFDEYHLLVIASDDVPRTGLEHLKSSFNSVTGRAFIDLEEYKKDAATLMTHEYTHSWCGKYYRPQGMMVPNYNTPMDTRMLWVYEGLDTYLGDVLAYRTGAIPYDEALEDLAYSVSAYSHIKGRRSIPLEDTASSAFLRRGGSPNWGELNRSQNYYTEGEFLWYEIDSTLRSLTDNEKNLDDFLAAFLGKHEKGVHALGYEETDFVKTLNGIAQYNWQELIDNRTQGLHKELPLEFVEKLGYRVEYTTEPLKIIKESSSINLRDSIGLSISSGGNVNSVVPGSPADEAGLFPGADIIGVNGRKFSKDRMNDAVADSTTKRKVELLMLEGEVFNTVTLEYSGGQRYVKLVRNEDNPDYLKEIWTARTGDKK